jgi:hypothetical protein
MCVKGARIGQRRQAEPETQEADSLRAKAQPFRESYRLGINEMGQHQGVNVTDNVFSSSCKKSNIIRGKNRSNTDILVFDLSLNSLK